MINRVQLFKFWPNSMLDTMSLIWRLGLPLSLTLMTEMIIVIVDSLFAGNIGYTELAAVSLGGSAFYIFLLLLIGFEMGCTIRAGQALGANDRKRVLHSFRQGIVLCLTFGIPFSIILLHISPLLLKLGQKPEVVTLCKHYLEWFAWVLPIHLLVILLRGYFAVIDRPWASVWPICLTLLLNAGLNYCLAFGNFGFPNMGISGIGLASLISNAVLLILMLKTVGWKNTQFLFNIMRKSVWIDKDLVKLFLISLPISLILLMEEAFFSGTNLLAGKLGAQQQAAHQILFNAVGGSYLFNSGIGMAVSIIIGKHVGAKNYSQIALTVWSGLVIVFICTIPFALVLSIYNHQWITLFLDESLSSNQTTILLAKSVMWIAVFSLFIDACMLIVIEALTGMLDTTYASICALFAYWIIAAPLAYWATLHTLVPFTWIWVSILLSSCILTLLVGHRLRVNILEFSSGKSKLLWV